MEYGAFCANEVKVIKKAISSHMIRDEIAFFRLDKLKDFW